MIRVQFRVLYREFLFRIIDLDLLAPEGDMSRLLGQFAALLVIVSMWVMVPAVAMAAGAPSELSLLLTWAGEHFLIATTLLVVGLFAVLSWEAMFPDRRDVLVLTPLPIHGRTLFVAKIAAVATALSMTVLVLNALPSLGAALVFASAPTLPPPNYNSALPPVQAANLQPQLQRDLEEAREPRTRDLILGKNAGITVGVLEHGSQSVFSYGTAHPDSIFEIGSITKTFTALLLARMAKEGRVRLDEPVRELLPPGTVAKPAGDEIRLLDLATHHSGLPRMPDNFHPADMENPYADYHAAHLYAYVAKRGVSKRGHPGFVYSNLGAGILGQALANRAGTTYAKLLQQEITGPLGMTDTAMAPAPEQRDRFIQGHSGKEGHRRVHAWDLDALAGAGGIRSTAGDLLKYLDAQLHPEKFPGLAPALAESHQLRDDVTGGRRIALGWMFVPDAAIYEHNGGTAGFSSYAYFDPQHDTAAVVLFNTGPSQALGPDQLGEHIRQRLMGERAVSLARPVVRGAGGAWNVLRSFAAYWITLFASSAFVFGLVLTLQGLAQLLPRQIFLRASSFLQLACFLLLLTVYFFQIPFAGPEALTEGARWIPWLPSYCFLAVFQQLNGALPSMMHAMMWRAWTGLALSLAGAAASYLICYFRTLRMIAEQPDIQPSVRRLRWLPRFGNSFQTAVGQFCVRTLCRSRQHRVILSFYLGIALGLPTFFSTAAVLRAQSTTGDIWHEVNSLLVIPSILLICGAVVGARIVFSIPLDLKANWIFRLMHPAAVAECLAASRRALYGMALLPVWLVMAAIFFLAWPWRQAAGHLLVLLLLGAITAELMLYGFEKIPFTCSYLPGKSYFHMAAIAFLGLVFLINKGYPLERSALEDGRLYLAMIAVLLIAGGAARWRTAARAQSNDATLQFEEEQDPLILGLGLYRDGALMIEGQERQGYG
jgi:CubicO group peptidase (beta-lactamase class C family)